MLSGRTQLQIKTKQSAQGILAAKLPLRPPGRTQEPRFSWNRAGSRQEEI